MIGDVVLQKRSGIVGWFVSLFTKSEYVHVGIDVGEDVIVHVDWRGKRTATYEEWADGLLVLSFKHALTYKQRVDLIETIMKESVKGYSFWNAVMSWWRKDPDDDKPTGTYNQCAEFVCRCYRKIGIDLVPQRSDDTTQPQDFLESPFLNLKALKT